MAQTVEYIINRVSRLRDESRCEEALKLVSVGLKEFPESPELFYQAAWTNDKMGNERDALPYYEKAIELGLKGNDLMGAYVGLGSTLRCLGSYKESLSTFNQAIKIFPNEPVFRVFRSLVYYNLSKESKSIEELLLTLLDTTNDEQIKRYEKALRFYSNKLDETWN